MKKICMISTFAYVVIVFVMVGLFFLSSRNNNYLSVLNVFLYANIVYDVIVIAVGSFYIDASIDHWFNEVEDGCMLPVKERILLAVCVIVAILCGVYCFIQCAIIGVDTVPPIDLPTTRVNIVMIQIPNIILLYASYREWRALNKPSTEE